MKHVKLFPGLLAAAVVMASCASSQYPSSDDYNNGNPRRIGNRVYVDDPFYGQTVLERDPFTGRYYDVTYGNRGFGSPYGTKWSRMVQRFC